ncbi:MAG: phytoene desaturase family protein [Bacteroidales bacterium]
MIYDIVIIGGGLGGLCCGNILSKKGFKVAILEKNPQIGGCLQSYIKAGATFETGLHYLGSLNQGQLLNKIFKYLGILDKISLQKLDENGFDHITFHNDHKIYKLAQGYENFIDVLAKDFPDEREAIRSYCDLVQNTCNQFSPYQLKEGNFHDKFNISSFNAKDEIEKKIKDPVLRNVIGGNNPLYSGVGEKTPFYIHALITDSFIQSAYKIKGGGSQLIKALKESFVNHGGEIFTNSQVEVAYEEDKKLTYVETTDNKKFYAKEFISCIHPESMIKKIKTNLFRKAFYKRFEMMEQTISPFVVNIKFKDSYSPINHNHYHYTINDVWDACAYEKYKWPTTFTLFHTTINDHNVKSTSLFSYLKYKDVQKWDRSFNTAYNKHERGQGYNEYKQMLSEKLIDEAEKIYPGLKSQIDSCHTSSPLTYRDYYDNKEGSLYGIQKNSQTPLNSFIHPRSKISNLIFSGQNINVHGIVGVSVSALISCGELLGLNNLIRDINHD